MIIGCDIGTAYTKAVLMEGNSLEKYAVVPTEANPAMAMRRVIEALGVMAGDDSSNAAGTRKFLENGHRIGVTGWGQSKLSSDHYGINLLNSVAKGALWAFPSCRSVLNIGAQGCLLLSLNDAGRVLEYRVNDKCATGSGRFLEVISGALEIGIEDISDVVKSADKQLTITSQCAVFSESEVVGLVNESETVANIMAAILGGLASSIVSISRRIRIKDDLVVAGGLAKNRSFMDMIRDTIGREIKVFDPPDIIAAIGAALATKGVSA